DQLRSLQFGDKVFGISEESPVFVLAEFFYYAGIEPHITDVHAIVPAIHLDQVQLALAPGNQEILQCHSRIHRDAQLYRHAVSGAEGNNAYGYLLANELRNGEEQRAVSAYREH